MHDSSKRDTLKILGATGASTVLPASLVMAEAATRPEGASQFPAAKTRTPDLRIELIRSTAMTEDSVILKNTTDETIVISKFMPGHVVFEDVKLDLNAAAGGESLIIKPNQVVSLRTTATPMLSEDLVEYVWANAAVHPVSDNLSVVELGSFMVDNQAVVYPINVPTAQTPIPA